MICPLVIFSDTNVVFGFLPNRTYQILFQVPPSSTVVRSRGGRKISELDRGPFYFQTTSVIFDRVPGPPVPTVTLLDDSGAEAPLDNAPFRHPPPPNIPPPPGGPSPQAPAPRPRHHTLAPGAGTIEP